jgi:hypothetical protein
VHRSADKEDLERLTDAELFRLATREVAVAVILAARAFQKQAGRLVAMKTVGVATLLRSLAACLREVNAAFSQASKMKPMAAPNGDLAED